MKFNWKKGMDKWLILLAVGLILLILTLPNGSSLGVQGEKKAETDALVLQSGIVTETVEALEVSARAGKTYEEELEERVRKLLKTVEGVGQVDVMIVLKSSEEKVLRVDRNTSDSATEEKDREGGTRKITSAEQQESTILTGTGENTAPIVEKEIRPEIEGIVVSAQGGGNATVKAEISAAMEALFNLPPHKIKVLKRVE